MGLRKCPRCELNYIKDDEKLCNVCRRSAKLSDESEEETVCIECGEHPALKGKELCAECYRESIRLRNRTKSKGGALEYEDVDVVTDVTLPDEEIPMGTLPDEIDVDFGDEPAPEPPKEEGEIEFTKGLSLEQMEEDEGNEPDDDDEIDEGFTPAKRKHR
ncbi:MAG: hypothetical protein IKG85_02660 [Clostridia bacterium]|nr:hypothetical protein [Clostridia bacterium]